MLRTGDRSVPTLTTLTTFGYGSKMIKRSKTWNCLISTSTAVHPLNIWFFTMDSMLAAAGVVGAFVLPRALFLVQLPAECQAVDGFFVRYCTHGPTTAPSHSKL